MTINRLYGQSHNLNSIDSVLYKIILREQVLVFFFVIIKRKLEENKNQLLKCLDRFLVESYFKNI